MRPLIQQVLVNNKDDSRMTYIKYSLEYAVAPQYEGMSVKELKQIFNFDDCESVPDVAHVTILSDLDDIELEDVREALKDDLSLRDSELIIC